MGLGRSQLVHRRVAHNQKYSLRTTLEPKGSILFAPQLNLSIKSWNLENVAKIIRLLLKISVGEGYLSSICYLLQGYSNEKP
jgi:hypothetical protein